MSDHPMKILEWTLYAVALACVGYTLLLAASIALARGLV